MSPVITGLENICQSPPAFLQQQRLGLLSNPASVNSSFYHAKDLIDHFFPGQLTTLFSPQHGFYADKQDNMIESDDTVDHAAKRPIYSLYGNTRKPTAAMMENIDILLVDLQDVGTRVYTFIYTLSYCMEAAKEFGKKVIILDRPNPIGGVEIEGNILEPEIASFVGRYPIPMRHGLTIGELARLFNGHFDIGCDLSIIPMTGWRRDMDFSTTQLPWVLPSPNLPTANSAAVYPGQVIWEATNISEGRGTGLPFEMMGAPYLDSEILISKLESDFTQGTSLRPVTFEPTSNKWQGETCHGFQIHVTDSQEYRPYRLSLRLLQLIMALYPNDFAYKPPPYEYEFEKAPIDLILGSKKIRKAIEAQTPIADLEKSWQPQLEQYKKISRKFHLYST